MAPLTEHVTGAFVWWDFLSTSEILNYSEFFKQTRELLNDGTNIEVLIQSLFNRKTSIGLNEIHEELTDLFKGTLKGEKVSGSFSF